MASEDYFMDIDLHQNKLLQAVIGETTATATEGQLAYTGGKLQIYTGDKWVPLTTEAVSTDGTTYYQLTAEKNEANGYVGLDGETKIAVGYLPTGNGEGKIVELGGAIGNGEVISWDATSSKFITKSIANVMTYKGTIDTLPSTANVGDVYNVTDTGKNFAWDGEEWDQLGDNINTAVFEQNSNKVTTAIAGSETSETVKYPALGPIVTYVNNQRDAAVASAATAAAGLYVNKDQLGGSVAADNALLVTGGVVFTAIENAKTTLNSSINNKLDTTTFNEYKTANDTAVAGKVAQTDYDTKVTALTEADTALGGRIDTLTQTVADNKSALETADTNLGKRIDLLDNSTDGRVTLVEADVKTLKETTVPAVAGRVTTLEEASITQGQAIAKNTSDIATVIATANAAVVANSAITAGTATKVTYDAKGLVTKGENLALTDLASITVAADEGKSLVSTGTSVAWKQTYEEVSVTGLVAGQAKAVATNVAKPIIVQLRDTSGNVIYADVTISSNSVSVMVQGANAPTEIVACIMGI